MQPRGIRNNNPGNIRMNPRIIWRGQRGQDADGFLIFSTPVMGLRAICKIFRYYERYDKLDTIAGFISKWAPPNENDTAAYIADVSRRVGVDATAPYDLHTDGLPLLKAIVMHENGVQPYDDATLNRAIFLSHFE